MLLKRLFFTAKFPMRLIAIMVVIFLVCATMLYFYDTILSGFDKLTWRGKGLVDQSHAKYLALMMSMVIGLGVFAESATTIWDKLMYWGQFLDNKLSKVFFKRTFFLDTANELLKKTRIEINRTNLQLQALMIPTIEDEENIEFLEMRTTKIKENCERINHLLESHQVSDSLNKEKQERARETLNRLVTANMEICYYVERLKGIPE